jgi:hypothetical protein
MLTLDLTGISKGQESKMAKELDKVVAGFHNNRPLD